MMKGRLMMGSIGALLLFAAPTGAEDKEPSTVLCMGGAGGWGVSNGGSSFGPEIGLEYTVIEHWLEIEVATSPQFGCGQAEFDTEVLFKKPLARFGIRTRKSSAQRPAPFWNPIGRKD